MALRFHTQTAGVSLTAQQPLNNIVRTAIEALAGVLGGTQSLHTNSYDEALALPTEKAVAIALRTQQIIAHETGVTNTVDPLGGVLLRRVADRRDGAQRTTTSADRRVGGMVEAIERGFPQREIADAAFELQMDIDAGRRVVVGVNRFPEGDRRGDATLAHQPGVRAAAGLLAGRGQGRTGRRRGGGATG